MEKAFGVSYPTVKARLDPASPAQLQLVEVAVEPSSSASRPPTRSDDVLGMLERGERSADEAADKLEAIAMPPLWLWLQVQAPERRPVRVWLPLFLVWLLLLPFAVLVLVVALARRTSSWRCSA